MNLGIAVHVGTAVCVIESSTNIAHIFTIIMFSYEHPLSFVLSYRKCAVRSEKFAIF